MRVDIDVEGVDEDNMKESNEAVSEGEKNVVRVPDGRDGEALKIREKMKVFDEREYGRLKIERRCRVRYAER
ncbi:hypothetical protein RYX36_015943 [Vicia faba]